MTNHRNTHSFSTHKQKQTFGPLPATSQRKKHAIILFSTLIILSLWTCRLILSQHRDPATEAPVLKLYAFLAIAASISTNDSS